MAKPDLQPVYVDPNDGQMKRLKGKLGLGTSALNQLPDAANDAAAALLDPVVAVGELYRTDSTIKVRIA